jgi:hypothetical protein
MKITQIVQETTTSGSVATVAAPLFKQSRKGGNLLTGTKTKKKYANSISEGKMKELAMDLKSGKDGLTDEEFKKKYGKSKQEMRKSLESNPVQVKEAEISEQDLILVPGQGRRMKPGFISKAADRTDREVEMALGDLFQAAKNAKMTYDMLKDISEDEGIEGWVQEKIIKASDYLNTIREYLENKRLQSEGTLGAVAGGVAGAYLGKSPSAAVTGAEIGSELQDTFTTEGMDPDQRSRLGDLIDQYKASTDPEYDSYNMDDEYLDSDEIIAQIRSEFGDRIAGQVESGYHKMHFGRTGHAQGYDPLSWKKANTRVTKGGKMYKQDSDYMKNTIKSRYKLAGKSATESVAEGAVDQLPTRGADYSKYDTEHLKMMLRPGILHRNEARFKALIRKELQKREQQSQQDVSEGKEELHAKLKAINHKLKMMGGEPVDRPNSAAFVEKRQALMKRKKEIEAQLKQGMGEGANVDRMVKHIEKSEEKAGKSKKEAENIAWATANKRGMLNNRNKK